MPLELRPPAVAGTFYPAAPRHLLAEVDDLLNEATVSLRPSLRRAPKALIVPHAGFRYSGPVAASAYSLLTPHAESFHRVVLLGPSHRAYFHGVALPVASAFETPLGVLNVDQAACALVPDVPRLAAAHAREHSLEVELPFLMRVLPRFSLVPLVVGDADDDVVAAVIDALWDGPETLIVISSDLSHYLPYEEARRVDAETAARIVDLGPTPLRHDQACGATPVNGLLTVARRRRLRPVRVDLRSSGDTAGSREQVVGYGSFAFYEETVHVQ